MTEPNRLNTIPGYEHPTELKYSKDVIYKTFTEGKKLKKYENTNDEHQYAITTDYVDTCPKCNESPVNVCPCTYNDKICSNNHIWYTNRDGQTKYGNPHYNN